MTIQKQSTQCKSSAHAVESIARLRCFCASLKRVHAIKEQRRAEYAVRASSTSRWTSLLLLQQSMRAADAASQEVAKQYSILSTLGMASKRRARRARTLTTTKVT